MDSETIINSSNTALTPAEIIKNATIIDEGIKLCPLCTSEVRLFFINFNEKVLMCENVECDYPFGHEEITYVKEDQDIQSYEEVASIKQTHSPTVTHSMISTAAWSDLAKITRVNESEELEHRPETREYYKHKAKSPKNVVKKDEVQPNLVKEIKALHEKDVELSKDNDYIKNEKWVQKLMKLQKSSGINLLKEEEIIMFKKSKPEIGLGELKIDIGTGAETNMSTIKIEIANVNNT
ncbi:hypothetical protein ABMA28_002972 [Loxostege sticticalis]|uniref:Uncharacterized protein n=1 Tax=Loxostege sticticalis TaxID=481309 RepID=A0ABD0SYM9_LOXSC